MSGIFIAFDNKTPAWVLWVAKVFPVRHFALGMQAGYVGTPFHWTDVLVVAMWGAAALELPVALRGWQELLELPVRAAGEGTRRAQRRCYTPPQ